MLDSIEKESNIKDARETYLVELNFGIYQLLHIKLYNKTNNELKSFSHILSKINGDIVEDNRSAKQIEEDTLNLFR